MTSADTTFGLIYYRPGPGRAHRHTAVSAPALAIAALRYLREGYHVRLSASAVEWLAAHPAGPEPARTPEGAGAPLPSPPVRTSPPAAPPAVFR